MSRIKTISVLILLALMLPAAIVGQMRLGAEGDKGWLFFAAQKLLSGHRLYVDIFEINPPLIVWLYAVACEVAAHVSFLKDYEALVLMGLAFTGASILISMRLMAEHPAFAGRRMQLVLFGALLAGIFVIFTNPVFFFDREHIMLVLVFPYFLRFMPGLRGRVFPLPLRIAVGVLAAAGFFIKLHAMLVFAAFQLVRLFGERPRAILVSVENQIIAALGIAYFAAIVTLTPDYLHTVLPMALATYSEFNVHASRQFYYTLAFFATAVIFADFRPRYRTPYRQDVYYFAAIALIYLGYTLINNGWGYTYHPLFCTIEFITAWLGSEYAWLARTYAAKGLPVEQFSYGRRACLTSLGITLCYTAASLYGILNYAPVNGYNDSKDNPAYVAYIRDHHIHSFGLMSGEFTRWPEISNQSGAAWVTRFNHLWMVPALVKAQAHGDTHLQPVLDYVANAYAQDLTQNRPDVVIVDTSDEFFTSGYPVDLVALFMQVPAFRSAWGAYRLQAILDHCKPTAPGKPAFTIGCRYTVYSRADLP